MIIKTWVNYKQGQRILEELRDDQRHVGNTVFGWVYGPFLAVILDRSFPWDELGKKFNI